MGKRDSRDVKDIRDIEDESSRLEVPFRGRCS
jgi:hypothetical protein